MRRRDPLYQAAAAEVEGARFWARLARYKKRIKLLIEVGGLAGGILYKALALLHARDVGRPDEQATGIHTVTTDRVPHPKNPK